MTRKQQTRQLKDAVTKEQMVRKSFEDEQAPQPPWGRSPEEMRKVLQSRARELARDGRENKTTPMGEGVEVVEFFLAYERYGIESVYVREIYPLKELTPVPCTPPFVLGIINVRGEIVSVIDIKKFFDLPGLSDLNKVIIVRDDRMEFGILADSILGVRTIPRDRIQPPILTLTGIGAEYLIGVTKEPIVILNAGKILSSSDLVVHEELEA
jgi:purine-binding chemotaxis protein CheW